MLAILICGVVGGMFYYAVRHFRAVSWYWHLLAIVAALAVGCFPISIELQKRGLDLLFDLLFVLLLFWGVGGLISGSTQSANPNRTAAFRRRTPSAARSVSTLSNASTT